jgi:hypothetical protein
MTNNLSPEVMEKIQQAVDSYPAAWHGGICAFKKIHRETGANAGGTSHGHCHAGILNIREDMILVNAHRHKNQAASEETKAFTLWVARESPFAHGVLNSHNEDELWNKASVIDVSLVGSAGCLWLCKAFRTCVEESWRIPVWAQLRKEGLDGFQAFIGASILNSIGDRSLSNTHCSLFHYDTPEKLFKQYEKIKNAKKLDGQTAAQDRWSAVSCINWGTLKMKTERKSDGWGGFVEKQIPSDAKEFAGTLLKIFKGEYEDVTERK